MKFSHIVSIKFRVFGTLHTKSKFERYFGNAVDNPVSVGELYCFIELLIYKPGGCTNYLSYLIYIVQSINRFCRFAELIVAL